MTLTVRPISSDQHRAYLAAQPSASFLQLPAWGEVKPEWRSVSLGWFDGQELVGVGLALLRYLPKLPYCLAYLPEGPVLDWAREDVAEQLLALKRWAKKNKAFALRIGPHLMHRAWNADSIKQGIANEQVTKLEDMPADETNPVAARLGLLLHHLGWLPPASTEGFSAGQPKFNFWLPLRHADGTQKTDEELLQGMNQLWRRNIKRAAKEGVEVSQGDREDLARFHQVYLETAERDGFTGRPLEYFQTMWDALRRDDEHRMRLYLAEHEGDLVAATTMVQVGEHTWYSYGASTTHKREVRGSNAIQWQMIRDANAAQAAVYDMRGIVDALKDHPELGLIQFKVGTGGRAVAYLGEWDMPLNKVLYFAFQQYMKRR